MTNLYTLTNANGCPADVNTNLWDVRSDSNLTLPQPLTAKTTIKTPVFVLQPLLSSSSRDCLSVEEWISELLFGQSRTLNR